MHVVIGTAGHIDHGKSTLVRALTGIDPDRLKEEKARGITIDLGFAHRLIGDVHVAFVDVPGHERFVRNMLAGVTGIDAVMLVVAADESVMPQTREHFAICRMLDVKAGLIALTKCDAADPELIELARAEVRELVAGSFLDGAPIVNVSARTGEGLEALERALAAIAPRERASERDAGAVRLPIDRAFAMRGFGAVVTGTLQSGVIRVEDDLELLPAGRHVRVRGVQMHGDKVREASSGHRVAVNLSDIDATAIARGDALVTPGAFEPSVRVDVTLELLFDARPLTHGTRVRVHHGTREVMARVAVAEVTSGAAGGGEPLAPTTVPPGGRARARLRLESPLVVTRGDRFVLRAYSPVTTIGGGLIIDPHPARGALRTPAGLARFAALDPALTELPLTPNPSPMERGLNFSEGATAPSFPPTFAASAAGEQARPSNAASASEATASRLDSDSTSRPISNSAWGPGPADKMESSLSPGGKRGAGGETGRLSSAAADERALRVMLDERGRAGLPLAALGTRLGLRGDAAIAAMAERITGAADAAQPAYAVRIGDLLISRTIIDRSSDALVDHVKKHHAAQPDSEGLPREEARDRLDVTTRVFDFVVERLTAAGTLIGRDRLALPAHRAAVPDVDAAALARAEALFRDAGLKPPDAAEFAQQLGLSAVAADRLIQFLVRQKRLVRLGALVFHHDALTLLKDETRALKAAAADSRATVDVASFKTRYGVSRKFAIPLLEYLDRERVTRRAGDERIVL
jgi:selenocysteine-specific elongation factor SelB